VAHQQEGEVVVEALMQEEEAQGEVNITLQSPEESRSSKLIGDEVESQAHRLLAALRHSQLDTQGSYSARICLRCPKCLKCRWAWACKISLSSSSLQ
jgi:hypothetical protein